MVLLADGIPVIIETTQAQNFKISPAQLRAAITDRTRLIFINSPSNPSGVAYSLDELKALGDVLKEFPNIIIATDDMYEHILWKKGTFVNILNAHPEFYDRTVVMNGVSKAYSMTGWRIGYAAGPADLIEAMCTIQSQSTSNPTSISQYAAEAALTGDQSFIDTMCVEFKKRHDYVVAELNNIDGVDCLETDGTFYVFPNVEKLIAKMDNIQDDLGFSEYLIEEAGVALVPGSAFGTPGHIRISIATSMANLENALARIKEAI
jgi:aspartate aminotransferase